MPRRPPPRRDEFRNFPQTLRSDSKLRLVYHSSCEGILIMLPKSLDMRKVWGCWYRMGGWTTYGHILDKYSTFVQSLSNICQISVHVQFLSKFCDECLNFVNICLHWTQIKMSICPIFHMLDKPWTNFCPIYDQDLSCSALAWKLLACPIFVKILSVSKVVPNLVKQKFLFGFYL